MDRDDGYFDERVAAVCDTYEDREEFASEDIEATVDFLAELAGGPALEFAALDGSACRSHSAACADRGSTCHAPWLRGSPPSRAAETSR